MRWNVERSETGGKCKHITVYCECYCMCHCFNSPQGRADKGKNESSSPRQNYWKCLWIEKHSGPRGIQEKNLQNLDTIMQTCPSLIFILIQDAISILYLSRWFVRVGKILRVMVFYFEALLRLLLSSLPFYSSDRCFCISSLCLSCAPTAAPWESTLWLTNPSCVLNDAPQASHVNFLFSAIQLAIWLNIGYKIIQWWWRRIYTRALLQNIRAASSINWHFIYARSTTSDCYCRKGGPRGFQQKKLHNWRTLWLAVSSSGLGVPTCNRVLLLSFKGYL
jgi:hypothetical protein